MVDDGRTCLVRWATYVGALTVLVVLATGCLARRRDDASPSANACTHCHGSPDNLGSALTQSAPPNDLAGNTSVDYPGVGAHAVHLEPTSTHEALACADCHVVPDTVEDEGHADTALPAEVVFGEQAARGDVRPHYDFASRTCSDVYCHLATTPKWRNPRGSAQACGSCHGLPPPPPHVQGEQCSECHGAVVDQEMRIIDASKHVDGTVQVDAPACNACHGDPRSSGEWNDDGNAPPRDARGRSSRKERGVGAHARHLAGGDHGRPVECTECHAVPERNDQDGHLDGLPATVTLRGVAESSGALPSYDAATLTCSDSWCHAPFGGDDSRAAEPPVWTHTRGALACDGCHSMPPGGAHPPSEQCASCHAGVVGADHRTIIDRSLHVDGVVQVSVPQDCGACHGSEASSAPPNDLDGSDDPRSRGVGAHRAHLQPNARSRSLQCVECHVVPDDTWAPGHLDTSRPAEVRFVGVARSFGADPRYDFATATCSDSYCHGAAYAGRDLGGTDPAPLWTVARGESLPCDSCHALPPPFPHPADDACSKCHHDVDEDRVITHPELHVDGDVTFRLPP